MIFILVELIFRYYFTILIKLEFSLYLMNLLDYKKEKTNLFRVSQYFDIICKSVDHLLQIFNFIQKVEEF